MPSLIAILGGDMTQLKAVWDSAVEYSAKTGSRIKNSMAVSLASQGGSALKDSIAKSLSGFNKPIFDFSAEGKSGAIRETLVLLREIGRGNWSRVPGSFSILVSQLGILPMLLSPLVLIPAAIVAAFVGVIYLTKKWGESLLALKWPEFNPEHIAKNLQKMNQAAEAQKEINREIEKSISLYTSASEAAKRVADVTKEHFDHLRKMNQYEEEKALAHSKSDKERGEIRAAFSKKDLELNAAERAQQIKNKQDEEKALKKESDSKLGEAGKIQVSSKQADEELMKQKKKAADEAREYLTKTDAEIQKERDQREQVAGPTLDLPTRKASDATREANRAEARRRIQDEKQFADLVSDNDEKRKKKELLTKDAVSAAGKMVEAGGEAQRLAAEKVRKDQDEADEAKAKLAAQEAQAKRTNIRPDSNSLQKIGGAYASIYDTTMLDVSKKTEQHLKDIKTILTKPAGAARIKEVVY